MYQQQHQQTTKSPKIKLRYYQEEAINSFFHNRINPHIKTHSLIEIFCGLGKTVIGLEIAKQGNYHNILIIVPTTDLQQQFLNHIPNHLKQHKIFIYQKKDLHNIITSLESQKGTIVLCTYYSTPKIINYRYLFDFVLLDEAHHCSDDLLQEFGQSNLLMMTATPTPNQTYHTIYKYKFNNALDDGFIRDYEIIPIIYQKQHGVEYYELNEILVNMARQLGLQRIAIFADFIKILKEGRSSTEQFEYSLGSNKTTNEMNQQQYDVWSSVKAVHCEIGKQQRKDIINGFKQQDEILKMISNVNIFGEGIDCAIDGVVLMNFTQNLRWFIQIIGRLLRKAQNCNIGRIIIPCTSEQEFKQRMGLVELLVNGFDERTKDNNFFESKVQRNKIEEIAIK